MPRLKMPRPVPLLAGQRVTLRPIDPPRDAQDYHEWNLEPEMHAWTDNGPLASPQEARRELERLAGMDDVTTWAVVDNSSGKMVGRFFIILEQRPDRLVAGEGNRIAKPFWRKGHNRQARQLVFNYIFGTLQADCIETECLGRQRQLARVDQGPRLYAPRSMGRVQPQARPGPGQVPLWAEQRGMVGQRSLAASPAAPSP